jgi:outer membrane biosynthesis protein TonB
MQVVASTSAAFEAAAMEAVQQSRFKSAKIRGQTVRQLVRQAVRFGMGREN